VKKNDASVWIFDDGREHIRDEPFLGFVAGDLSICVLGDFLAHLQMARRVEKGLLP